jgi:hypothetical protein
MMEAGNESFNNLNAGAWMDLKLYGDVLRQPISRHYWCCLTMADEMSAAVDVVDVIGVVDMVDVDLFLFVEFRVLRSAAAALVRLE